MWNYTARIHKLNDIKVFIFLLLSLGTSLSSYAQSKSELLEDLDSLYHNILNIHPDPFRYISEKKFKKLKSQIANKVDENCSVDKFYILTAPLIAALQDGHSCISIPVTESRISYLNKGGLVFPFRLEIDSLDRFIIKANMSKCVNIKVGEEIISINGIKSKRIIRQFHGLFGGENNLIKSIQLRDYISTLLWYFYHFENGYYLEVSQGGKINKYYVDGISSVVAKSKMRELLPSVDSTKDFDLIIDHNKATLKIKSFYDTDHLTGFLYDSFSRINSTGIDSLVIDIRDNLGGRSASIDTLLFFISNKPYELYPRIELKVSEKLKKVYRERGNPLFCLIDSMAIGSVYSYSSGVVSTNSDREIFNGYLDVVLNKASYSASLTFASVVRSLERGRLLGYTDYPNSYYGDFISLILPHSKLQVFLSTKMFYNCEKSMNDGKP